MAYVVQLHNGIYSETSVQYLRRITRGVTRVVDRSKPLILVAHQFTGDAIVSFNDTVRELNVMHQKFNELPKGLTAFYFDRSP